jgi:DNA-binding response OmpR family regulator
MSDYTFRGRTGDVYEGSKTGGGRKYFYGNPDSEGISVSSSEGKVLEFLMQHPDIIHLKQKIAQKCEVGLSQIDVLAERIKKNTRNSLFFQMDGSARSSSYSLNTKRVRPATMEKLMELDARIGIVPESVHGFDRLPSIRSGDIYLFQKEGKKMLSVGDYNENSAVSSKSEEGKLLTYLYKHRGDHFDEEVLVRELGIEDREVFERLWDMFDESVFFEYDVLEDGPSYGLVVKRPSLVELADVVALDRKLGILHEVVYSLKKAA